jgi:hypothetical protein
VTTHKKPKSLFRRLIYFVVMLITGGGAGAGSWLFREHPQMQALLGIVMGKSDQPGADGGDLKAKLASAVTEVLKRDYPRQPGVFKVKITEIKLDPKLFKDGRTVDIQARISRIDGRGEESIVWESKAYGENLAVAGKDDLSATFPNRPFEIDWSPGDRVVVQVWDRKSFLFDKRELKMALPEPGVFPLTTGTHALAVASRGGSSLDSDQNRIVFQTERLSAAPTQRSGGSRSADATQVAERPIVIK